MTTEVPIGTIPDFSRLDDLTLATFSRSPQDPLPSPVSGMFNGGQLQRQEATLFNLGNKTQAMPEPLPDEAAPPDQETTGKPHKRRGRPRKSSTKAAIESTTTVESCTPATNGSKRRKSAKRLSMDDCGDADEGADAISVASIGTGIERETGAVPDAHARRRSRNREAASKCRARKQRGIERLQSEEVAAETYHYVLAAEVNALRSEVLVLKNMLLQHNECGCSFIENYIKSSAFKLGHRTVKNPASTVSDAMSAESGSVNQPLLFEENELMAIDPTGFDGVDDQQGGTMTWNNLDTV